MNRKERSRHSGMGDKVILYLLHTSTHTFCTRDAKVSWTKWNYGTSCVAFNWNWRWIENSHFETNNYFNKTNHKVIKMFSEFMGIWQLSGNTKCYWNWRIWEMHLHACETEEKQSFTRRAIEKSYKSEVCSTIQIVPSALFANNKYAKIYAVYQKKNTRLTNTFWQRTSINVLDKMCCNEYGVFLGWRWQIHTSMEMMWPDLADKLVVSPGHSWISDDKDDMRAMTKSFWMSIFTMLLIYFSNENLPRTKWIAF